MQWLGLLEIPLGSLVEYVWMCLYASFDALVFVAEPPKLYGPHVPIIVSQTSDCCTREPDNFGNLSSVLGEL